MPGNARITSASRLLAGVSMVGLLLIVSSGRRQNGITASGLASPDWLQTAGGAIDEGEYWRFVDLVLRRLAEIETAPPETAAELLSTTISEWEDLKQVALPDGTILPVAHGVLLSRLSADPPDVASVRQMLQRMQRAHLDWPAPRHGSEALSALAQVLARPEFHWEGREPSRLSQILSSLRERLLGLWYGALDRVVGAFGPNRGLRWLVFAAGALALAWLTARAARRVLGGFAQEIVPEGDKGEPGKLFSAQEALRLAHDLSLVGDYRAAVRYLYISSLISLEERGILRHDRSMTNREYLRMLADRPDLADLLREVVEVFDRVWYGFQRLDQASFARFAARVEDLRRRK